MIPIDKLEEVRRRINVGPSVAAELLTLAGNDVELVCSASKEATGLDQCKAKIIDQRFKRIEK